MAWETNPGCSFCCSWLWDNSKERSLNYASVSLVCEQIPAKLPLSLILWPYQQNTGARASQQGILDVWSVSICGLFKALAMAPISIMAGKQSVTSLPALAKLQHNARANRGPGNGEQPGEDSSPLPMAPAASQGLAGDILLPAENSLTRHQSLRPAGWNG